MISPPSPSGLMPPRTGNWVVGLALLWWDLCREAQPGSLSPERVLPRFHAWQIVRRSDESVDDQIQHLMDRLEPVRAELVALCSNDEVSPMRRPLIRRGVGLDRWDGICRYRCWTSWY
ncbi:DUF4279 domain-containing protein [Nocardia sp. CDC160]|uniref:DUF4279 domain-containing protein n=1 Tax=Nocardia sp. CDC160 TaxID=3112166 RepID=UPI003FA3BC3C